MFDVEGNTHSQVHWQDNIIQGQLQKIKKEVKQKRKWQKLVNKEHMDSLLFSYCKFKQIPKSCCHFKKPISR